MEGGLDAQPQKLLVDMSPPPNYDVQQRFPNSNSYLWIPKAPPLPVKSALSVLAWRSFSTFPDNPHKKCIQSVPGEPKPCNRVERETHA